jgi:predicted enzyme related to lactoylglutathione lyase
MSTRTKRTGWWMAVAWTLLAAPLAAEEVRTEIWGIELGTPDVAASRRFYEALGFEPLRDESGGLWTLLRNGEVALVLSASDRRAAAIEMPRIYLNLSVGDLDRAARTVRENGGSVDPGPPAETPVGRSLSAADPAGHPLHLIDHPGDDLAADAAPKVFNLGVTSAVLDGDERFFAVLGLGVASRDYLPATLVLERRGASYLVLHPRTSAPAAAGPVLDGGRLLLHSPGPVLAGLRDAGLAVGGARMPAGGLGAGDLELRSPSGVAVAVARRPPVGIEDERRARAAFERFQGLAGRWRAKSTRGWSEEVSYEVAARGSAVIGRTRFRDAPDRSMATFFVLDGTRLVVTHVCEARNQPRLEATRISADAAEVEITFLDATALTSRDRGHMDRAVYRFEGPDRFSSRWTWYQDGSEGWMEEITYVRIDEAAAANGP